MKIIEVTEKWIDQVAVLFNNYRMFYEQKDDLETSKQFLKDRVTNKESIIFMALINENTPLGFVQIYPVFSSISCKKDFILNDLYVVEQHRGKGIGALLLEKAKKHAYEEGGKGLALETAKDNPARKLYERLGWHLDQDYLHYYWKSNNYSNVEQKLTDKKM